MGGVTVAKGALTGELTDSTVEAGLIDSMHDSQTIFAGTRLEAGLKSASIR
ncbi:hypothetical protein [Kineosporia babensis]|uniref:Uncharacterized protein n=1 Tax=Kineosporia babensis TaxID=499548 RepID=A0A9X1NBI6_9ACTN|nr:hypothetical protein [Kineosporia babensis]MCD5311093.1 hypothetical protein [Kineosporia babensis]